MFILSLSPRTIADNSRTVTAVSRGGAIIADFLLVLATWRNLKTGMTYGDRKSLASILLWNGEPTRFFYSATCYTSLLTLGFLKQAVFTSCQPSSYHLLLVCTLILVLPGSFSS